MNPRALLRELGDSSEKFEFRTSVLHGDLHSGNLLLATTSESYRGPTDEYWVIDFDESREGGIGFDQSYLFTYRLMLALREAGLVPTLALLEASESDAADPDDLPFNSHWTLQFIRSLARAEEVFTMSTVGRADILQRQFQLARIAAALTWARRGSVSPDEARVACAVAGLFRSPVHRTL